MTNLEVSKSRNMIVTKHNDLIQKTRFDFTIHEQKILLYLISQLKPDQKNLEYQKFDILEFCKICGIEKKGRIYTDLKETINSLMMKKPLWLKLDIDSDRETTVRWIDEVRMSEKSGTVEIKLDNKMKPFLLEMKNNFTRYSLINTLGMRSKYAIRLYELLKSLQNKNETIFFSLEDFQQKVGSSYDEWYDIKRFVVEIALAEINGHTDIKVSYEVEKKGRAVHKVLFTVEKVEDIQEKLQVNINQQTKLSK